MSKCNADIIIKRGLVSICFKCRLDKHSKGKHRFEGMSEGKLYKIEWWDELPVIKGLTEMYIEERAIEKGYKK